jgi:hypothetical protein
LDRSQRFRILEHWCQVAQRQRCHPSIVFACGFSFMIISKMNIQISKAK